MTDALFFLFPIISTIVANTMTDENETNVNGETDKSGQIPLSKSIDHPIQCVIFLLFFLEMLVEISTNSTIENQIYSVIRQNFLEPRSITWKPIKVELIVNSQLTDDFFGKYPFSFCPPSLLEGRSSFLIRSISKTTKYFSSFAKNKSPNLVG